MFHFSVTVGYLIIFITRSEPVGKPDREVALLHWKELLKSIKMKVVHYHILDNVVLKYWKYLNWKKLVDQMNYLGTLNLLHLVPYTVTVLSVLIITRIITTIPFEWQQLLQRGIRYYENKKKLS